MLRSYLLSIKFKVTSITRWVALLKENPLYAILSGFSIGDVPGIGTFYDFFDRLWNSDSNHFSPKDRLPKPKVKKGKKQGDKTPADTDTISARLIPFFERHPVKPSHAFSLLFKLYYTQFLLRSVSSGLIDSKHLALAGDGTPFRTSSRQRSKRLCDCREKGIMDCSYKFYCKTDDANRLRFLGLFTGYNMLFLAGLLLFYKFGKYVIMVLLFLLLI